MLCSLGGGKGFAASRCAGVCGWGEVGMSHRMGGVGSERGAAPVRIASRACWKSVLKSPVGLPAVGFWCEFPVGSFVYESGGGNSGVETSGGGGNSPAGDVAEAATASGAHCKLIVIFCP
jgi:hypothetical protein